MALLKNLPISLQRRLTTPENCSVPLFLWLRVLIYEGVTASNSFQRECKFKSESPNLWSPIADPRRVAHLLSGISPIDDPLF